MARSDGYNTKTCLLYTSQTVAQSTAAGVAHVHGAGGVGGHEFHIVLGTLAVIGAATVSYTHLAPTLT